MPERKEKEPLIPVHGGYRNLRSFQVAQLVYDVTVRFCDRYIEKRSRTHDQMVQAARSGVQNIAEGSAASATSKKTELKLTNVARASLEELRLDYEDFLRQRRLAQWDRKDPRRQHLIDSRCTTADAVARWCQRQRGLSGPSGQSSDQTPPAPGLNTQPAKRSQTLSESTKSTKSTQSTSSTAQNSTQSTSSTKSTLSPYPEIAANAALVLIAVASGLLDRQLASLAASFEKEGGFTERLYRVRKKARGASS